MTSRLERPRSAVRVNGQIIDGLKGWTWDGNTMFQADTFRVEFAAGRLPQGHGLDWWASQSDIDVEFLLGYPQDGASFDPSELNSLFQGRVDELSVEWAGSCLRLTGRDRTADLIDNKTSEKYVNLTASQIAEKLASAHGLNPVITSTSTKVGRYYDTDHIRLQDDRTEWDLLTWLAREEGFVTYVKGKDLHFEPPAKGASTYAVKWVPGSQGQTPSGNFVRLETSRVLTVAKDITVIVRSWHGKQKKAFVRKATKGGKSAAGSQQYVRTIAGLTPEEAQRKANQILAELSKHEMRLSLDGPADNALGKADIIGLSGTGTAFDQSYYPDTISRSFDESSGYRWSVRAKNHSGEGDANL